MVSRHLTHKRYCAHYPYYHQYTYVHTWCCVLVVRHALSYIPSPYYTEGIHSVHLQISGITRYLQLIRGNQWYDLSHLVSCHVFGGVMWSCSGIRSTSGGMHTPLLTLVLVVHSTMCMMVVVVLVVVVLLVVLLVISVVIR